MVAEIPIEVAERIRRRAPEDCCVIPGSLPVVSFGSPVNARVATLSLNPSDKEFLGRDKVWLLGPKQRLDSLTSLGLHDPRDLTDEQIDQVADRCYRYFEGPVFNQWFGHLERLMTLAGVNGYSTGNACHLDVVQWATDPTASALPAGVWSRLVADDLDFLTWQLSVSPVDVILINGVGALNGVKATGIAGSFTEDVLVIQRSNGPGALRVSRAVSGNVLYLAWNLTLANGLSKDGLNTLATWIHDRVDEHDARAFGEIKP